MNRIVPAPVGGSRDSTALSSRVHLLELPLERDEEAGWKPHGLFRGSTADLADLRCHVSVLEPGRSPHPPHRHDEEEILVVLDGEARLVTEDPNDPTQPIRLSASRGTFAYYPRGFAHTIENTSEAPVTYVMFKWVSDLREPAGPLPRAIRAPRVAAAR